jgi:hypothetical protein
MGLRRYLGGVATPLTNTVQAGLSASRSSRTPRRSRNGVLSQPQPGSPHPSAVRLIAHGSTVAHHPERKSRDRAERESRHRLRVTLGPPWRIEGSPESSPTGERGRVRETICNHLIPLAQVRHGSASKKATSFRFSSGYRKVCTPFWAAFGNAPAETKSVPQ